MPENLAIMRQDVFCGLFGRQRLSRLLCTYYGTFSFGIFNTPPRSPKRHVLKVCGRVQRLLNVLFRLTFGARSAENKYVSPYLVFIGTKEG